MDHLIQQMGSEKVYSPLLKDRSGFKSSDQISGYAFRRAEQLNTSSQKKQLLDRLGPESDPVIQRYIYFCLAHLCTNTTDNELFNFLMDKMKDLNNNCRESILIGIEKMEKQMGLNIDPIAEIKERNG